MSYRCRQAVFGTQISEEENHTTCTMSGIIHKPVLLEAVLTYLKPQREESYLDLTAGYGGHAAAVLKYTQAPARATLVDRDKSAIEALTPLKELGAELLHTSFAGASQELRGQGRKYDMILADLGVSSLHLDTSERGFSFSLDGPLDMRMDQRGELTASTIVNAYSQQRLEDILRHWGEESRARSVAVAIVRNRPFDSTRALAQTIAAVMPRGGRHHPATKSFQALRIEVNDELGQLERSLPVWFDLLSPGGRLAIISFHSLEDRIVKRAYADVAGTGYDAEYTLLTRRPISADENEIAINPRARSAKLRALQLK